MALTRFTFGFQVRLVRLWEWLTLMPKDTPLSQNWHFAIFEAPPCLCVFTLAEQAPGKQLLYNSREKRQMQAKLLLFFPLFSVRQGLLFYPLPTTRCRGGYQPPALLFCSAWSASVFFARAKDGGNAPLFSCLSKRKGEKEKDTREGKIASSSQHLAAFAISGPRRKGSVRKMARLAFCGHLLRILKLFPPSWTFPCPGIIMAVPKDLRERSCS